MKEIWNRLDSYSKISAEGRTAWESLFREKTYRKNDCFLTEGQIPKTVAFVRTGLFSQYFTAENGDVIIKRFFPENYFVASLSAMLGQSPGIFTIKALEPTTVIEFDFFDLKKLMREFPDIMAFYVRYLELHWVIEKEPLEISLRYETAKSRYFQFLKDYPAMESRLKQHEIAAYLGVTPTQLSRIRSGLPD